MTGLSVEEEARLRQIIREAVAEGMRASPLPDFVKTMETLNRSIADVKRAIERQTELLRRDG